MRRWILLGALLGALLLAIGLGFAVPRLSVVRYSILAAGLLLAPGLVELARRRDATAVSTLIAGVVGAPIVVAATWLLAHPQVHVDDAMPWPVQLWIDGERSIVVAPTPATGEPPRLRIAWGKRRLGWSRVGADGPEHEIDTLLDLTGEHLYDPGAAGCYWLEATAYGKASLRDVVHGPLRVDELLHFQRVDVWFGSNAGRRRTSAFSSGDVSIALQRYQTCMELAREGCDAEERDQFVVCETTLRGPSQSTDCFAEALDRCRDQPSGVGGGGPPK